MPDFANLELWRRLPFLTFSLLLVLDVGHLGVWTLAFFIVVKLFLLFEVWADFCALTLLSLRLGILVLRAFIFSAVLAALSLFGEFFALRVLVLLDGIFRVAWAPFKLVALDRDLDVLGDLGVGCVSSHAATLLLDASRFSAFVLRSVASFKLAKQLSRLAR